MRLNPRSALDRLGRLVAALLVCATGLAPALHAEGQDDRLCAPRSSGEAGDPVLHAAGGPQAQHCEICHWLRSLRSFDASDAGVAAGETVATRPVPPDPRPGDPPPASPASSRAPPRA